MHRTTGSELGTRVGRRAAVAVPLMVSFALSGCSGGSAPSAEVDPAVAGQAVPTYPPNSRGPLDEYLSSIARYAVSSQEQWAKDFVRIQDLIAPCMKEQGFEYIPVPWIADPTLGAEADPDELDWDTLEYARQFGYGIADSPGAEMTISPDLKEPPDVNQPYIDSLNDSEREAYYEALYGVTDDSSFDEERNKPDPDPAIVGCSTLAHDLVGLRQATLDPEFAELFDLIDETGFASWDSTPELVALNKEWSSCMADRGFVFADRSEPKQHLHTLLHELLADVSDKEEVDIVDIPAEKLEAFQNEEINTAVADYECAESINFSNRATHIEYAVQQAFVDEHRAQLDALAARFG